MSVSSRLDQIESKIAKKAGNKVMVVYQKKGKWYSTGGVEWVAERGAELDQNRIIIKVQDWSENDLPENT